ncbi:MAG: phenylalanine--tRNA ligase subunit beta [Chthonomonas sp.]|nr:phenylalanine--tRNA ligase subunit beta [Chthonomonas sp.]
MKLPVSLLRSLVETNLSAEQIGDLLTMAGFELEGLDVVAGQDVLDIKVMANRGDGLSALGLAREILAKDAAAKPTELYNRLADRIAFGDENGNPGIRIQIETEDCTRFAARLIRGVKNGASPAPLQAVLEAAGLRPISLLVDLTNYVMLEMGQPLHAYDLGKLGGPDLGVRLANAGETLTTLNGDEHKLTTDHMVIFNANGAIGLAGVMGGLSTECDENTTDVLLEAAHFVNTRVRKTRKENGLNTDASYRFERSVDPEGVVSALNRFVELYMEAVGAQTPMDAGVLSGVADVYPRPPQRREVTLRIPRAVELLGMPITTGEAIQHLSRLGMDVRSDGDTLRVALPSWRPDILREEDLVEELGRVHGYDKIPESPIVGHANRGGIFGVPKLADQARAALLRCGCDQVINHTLRDKHALDFSESWRLGPRNPHSPEMALMRDSLLPGLAESALRNGGRNVHLFEVGQVFLQGDYQVDESPEVAILSTGQLTRSHWSGGNPSEADFFSIKGMVEELAGALNDSITFDLPHDPDRRFHPTRQAGVLLDHGRLWAGTVGQIHPDLANELGLPEATFMAELDLLVFAIQDDMEHAIHDISRHPATRRDIAVMLPKSVPFATVIAAVNDACGDVLEDSWLFDVYEGQGVPEGNHSLALALQFRKMGATFTDEEANAVRDRAVSAVTSLGGVLR